jgi:exodeoxyribonuclease VIII
MDIMIDLESMGIPEPTANVAIVSLAACMFDPNSLEHPTHTFYERIDLNSGVDRGMWVSDSTIEWWKKQSDEARAEIEKGGDDLAAVMKRFLLWISNLPFKIQNVWANDPDFDIAIIQCNLHAVKMHWPFKFYMNRSFRTIKDLAWPNGPQSVPHVAVDGPKHHALTDTIQQAKIVQLAKAEFRQLREIRVTMERETLATVEAAAQTRTAVAQGN